MHRILLLACALALAGCDDALPPPPEAAPSPTPLLPSPVPTPTGCADVAAAEAGPAKLIMEENQFVPWCFVVNATQALQISNADPRTHNLTVEGRVDIDVAADDRIETEPLQEMTGPGTFDFICKYHVDEGMRGLIIVT